MSRDGEKRCTSMQSFSGVAVCPEGCSHEIREIVQCGLYAHPDDVHHGHLTQAGGMPVGWESS